MSHDDNLNENESAAPRRQAEKIIFDIHPTSEDCGDVNDAAGNRPITKDGLPQTLRYLFE